MATAGDGVTPYQSGGAGGKFRKRPIRKSAPATPYDRPPTALRNNNLSLLSKLVDPASRLIYAGADRLFGVFRKRLPSISAPRPPETSEEPRNGIPEAGLNAVSEKQTTVSEAVTNANTTEISELENMLKQKTFTRSEIEHLTALLHARTTESDAVEEDRTKLPNTTSHILRIEASTSGPLSKQVEEREILHTTISTPVINSRVFDEDVASPAELAKAYMGTRPAKVSPSTLRFNSQPPRQDSALLNNTTIIPRTPVTSLSLVPKTSSKPFENGFTTPRSRGRSAIYNMARTPYYRGPSTSTFSQKVVASPSWISSQPAREQEGPIGSSKMAAKRRSSALGEIGSGGPMRRIRQKASLLSQQTKSTTEFRSTQKLKAVEDNGESSKRYLSQTSVPTESSKMASKIFEQLERMSPKEKPSGSRLALDIQKPESTSQSQSQSQSKDKGEENVQRKFAVPLNVLSSITGNSPINDSKLKQSAEPPQKKRAFHMSTNEVVVNKDVSDDVIITESSKLPVKPEVDAPKTVSGSPVPAQPILRENTAVEQKEAAVSPTSTKSAEKASLFSFSANKGSDAKPLSYTNSTVKNDQVQFPSSNNNDNEKGVNIFGKLETASPTSASGVFSTNGTPAFGSNTSKLFGSNSVLAPSTATSAASSALSSSVFASSSPVPAFGSNTSKLFGSSSVLAPPTATSADSSASPTSASAPAPIFSFGSKTPTSVAPPPEKEPSSMLFGSTAGTGGSGIFGFSSSSTTSTSAATQANPFKFTSSTTATPPATSVPSFGLSSAVASSDIKTGGSTSNPTTSIFSSGFGSTPSFGLTSSAVSGASASIFGSQPPQSTTPPPFSFGASSNNANASTPFSFTATNANSSPVFGKNNNDNMNMEDSMAEDSTPAPSPLVPSFGGGAPGFMFGSPAPTPSPVSFQFGGQTSQQPLQPPQQPSSQNPFQAPGGVDFNSGGGSFSLGSGGGGGGDKSGRRIVRINKSKNRRK